MASEHSLKCSESVQSPETDESMAKDLQELALCEKSATQSQMSAPTFDQSSDMNKSTNNESTDPKTMTKNEYIEAIRSLIDKYMKGRGAAGEDACSQSGLSDSQGDQQKEPKVKERKMKKCAESDTVAARKY